MKWQDRAIKEKQIPVTVDADNTGQLNNVDTTASE